MKKILLSVMVAFLSLSFVAEHVDAKRLGGGSSSGLRRQMPARQAPAAPAVQPSPASPQMAPGVPPTAAPKRNWMGPIAGLAAGLGLAALMSHFGMGEQMGNIIMMFLVAAVAMVALRWLMQRFAPARQPALATPVPSGAGVPQERTMYQPAPANSAEAPILSGPSFASVAAGAPSSLPAGFDVPAFERIAKLIFIRMQAANDAANLDDLRQFATPEMFAVFKLDLQDRQGAVQQTDVVQLDAEVLDFADEADRQIVSVRFHGLIREEKDSPTIAFDEIWHLVKAKSGSGDWAIAGIAQA